MSLRHYLDRYAEPDAALAASVHGEWDRVLAIPACSEVEGLESTLRSVAETGPGTLVVVVVNAAEDSPAHHHARNLQGLAVLDELIAARPFAGGALGAVGDLAVAVIDRASPGRRMPAGQGVGLARKIGADVATALIADGRVASRWIWMTDADVQVPRTYFHAAATAPSAAALTVPFTHVLAADPAQARAGQLYDLSLRYYVLGLAWARSPYAYHTVGSTVVADAVAYAKVRGFPRRNAAEDFYLLGKLAKVGGIFRAAGDPVRVDARVSDRVPFGTGAAITRLWSDADARDAFSLYDPRCFAALQGFLRGLDGFAESCDDAERARTTDSCSGVSGAVREELDARLGLARALAAARRASPRPDVRRRHLHTWFDALRTLKFVHAIRDIAYPNLPWGRALAAAPFVDAGGALPAAHAAVVAADARLQGRMAGRDEA